MCRQKSSTFKIFALVAALLVAVALVACGREERAPLPSGVVDRVAFGSCAMQWLEQPIWDAVAASEPDLFLYIGDAIYGDWDGEKVVPATEASLHRDWGKLAAIPEFARFRGSVPIMATWDNHDYGTHNGGAEFHLKETSRDIFLDFFGEPADSKRRNRSGVYDAKVFGPPGQRLQIILLDTRYNKGPFVKDDRSREEKQELNIVGKYVPNNDPDVTLLGEEQWRWLEALLREPAEVRLVVSGTQIVADEKGMDEWGNYPHERQRLFDLIERTRANGVVLLSGNVHFGEVSRVETTPWPLYDFTSSGLTHVNEDYAKAVNSYRVAGPYTGLNFGMVEIDWDAEPLTVHLRLLDVDGEQRFEQEIKLVAGS